MSDAVDIEHLRRNSQMLSMIAGEVESFCESAESTTLEAVLRMKALLLQYQADEAFGRWRQEADGRDQKRGVFGYMRNVAGGAR